MKQNQKIIIAIVMFAVILGLFAGGIIYPIFQGVLKDHTTVLEQKRELLQIEENRRRSNDFDNIYVQYNKEFSNIESMFVDQDTPVAFFRFLDETAVAFGLETDKTPDDPKLIEGDFWPSAEVRLKGSGTYSGILGFLEKIESAPFLLEVESLSIEEHEIAPIGGEERKIRFSVAVKFFVK